MIPNCRGGGGGGGDLWSKEWRVSTACADWLIAVSYSNLGDTLIPTRPKLPAVKHVGSDPEAF